MVIGGACIDDLVRGPFGLARLAPVEFGCTQLGQVGSVWPCLVRDGLEGLGWPWMALNESHRMTLDGTRWTWMAPVEPSSPIRKFTYDF